MGERILALGRGLRALLASVLALLALRAHRPPADEIVLLADVDGPLTPSTDLSVIAPSETAIAAEPPVVQPRRVKRRPVDRAPTLGDSPRWHFRRDILEKLDVYFDCMRRMRLYDPDSYALLSQTGLAIPADCYWNPHFDNALQKIVGGARPGFGGVLVGRGTDLTYIYPSFLYFQKLKHPSGVQQAHGDIYVLTVLFDSGLTGRANLVAPCKCHVAIKPDGAVALLKESVIVRNHLYRRAGRRKERVELKGIQWRYPEWCVEVAHAHNTDTSVWAAEMLLMALGTYEDASARTVIRVKQRGTTAAFGVDLSRCPRFFADRDATALARDGRRKRIFHAVVRHTRRITDHSVEVKAHYRGLRHFDWKTYRVGIVLPAYDLRKVTVASKYVADIAPRESRSFIGMQETGEKLAAVLDS